MNCCKKITIYLRSNLNGYNVVVRKRDGIIYRRVTSRCDCLSFYTTSKRATVIIYADSARYNQSYFFTLDLTRVNEYCFSTRFLTANADTTKAYVFYLTDINYGLKINGKLFFNNA